LAGAFLATTFFATTFLAGAFFAGAAFLAAGFFAVAISILLDQVTKSTLCTLERTKRFMALEHAPTP
jgi:hypothetical protein